MIGLSPDDIHAAAKQLSGQIIHTPTLPAPALSLAVRMQSVFKT